MKNVFYYRTIWSHVVAFSDLFNDIKLHIYEKDRTSAEYGKVIGYKNVPVVLAPKEKVISTLSALQGSERAEVDNILPKISIAWNGIDWVPDRMRGQKQKRNLFVEYLDTSSGTQRVKHYDLQTSPYSLKFEVVIWTKYMDDGVQILENILPFFTPETYISIKERGVEIERKCLVRLESVSPNFVYELNEPDRRLLQWNLSFSVECNLYKPIYFEKEIFVTRISFVDMSKSSSYQAHGETLTMGVSGQPLPGIDPYILSRISEIDQATSATAQISGANYIIDVDSWRTQQPAIFTPTNNGGNGQLQVTMPIFEDAHNPPNTYLHPEARHFSYEYYNKLNPEAPILPDEDSEQEYQDWKNTKGPPPLQV